MSEWLAHSSVILSLVIPIVGILYDKRRGTNSIAILANMVIDLSISIISNLKLRCHQTIVLSVMHLQHVMATRCLILIWIGIIFGRWKRHMILLAAESLSTRAPLSRPHHSQWFRVLSLLLSVLLSFFLIITGHILLSLHWSTLSSPNQIRKTSQLLLLMPEQALLLLDSLLRSAYPALSRPGGGCGRTGLTVTSCWHSAL